MSAVAVVTAADSKPRGQKSLKLIRAMMSMVKVHEPPRTYFSSQKEPILFQKSKLYIRNRFIISSVVIPCTGVNHIIESCVIDSEVALERMRRKRRTCQDSLMPDPSGVHKRLFRRPACIPAGGIRSFGERGAKVSDHSMKMSVLQEATSG